ncbi:MAG: lamin tail domain-containing protein [bacterium]
MQKKSIAYYKLGKSHALLAALERKRHAAQKYQKFISRFDLTGLAVKPLFVLHHLPAKAIEETVKRERIDLVILAQNQERHKMSKRAAKPTRTGQLAGARIKILGVYNHGLREFVTIINRGTVAQPLGGWVLVARRGNRFYFFPDDLILMSKMQISIHSGFATLNNPPHHLFWTDEQMWSNRNDVALLFDSNGLEIDRIAYSHKRMLGHDTQRRQRLLNDGETWQLVDEPLRQTRKIVRQARGTTGLRHALR